MKTIVPYFVSYAQRDQRCADRLLTRLADQMRPSRNYDYRPWRDTQILVGEDWDAWVDCFTDDVVYVEHVLGIMHGREAVRAWIKPIMAQYGEIYTAYEWHMIDPATGRVCVYMQNRRDHPSGSGVIDRGFCSASASDGSGRCCTT